MVSTTAVGLNVLGIVATISCFVYVKSTPKPAKISPNPAAPPPPQQEHSRSFVNPNWAPYKDGNFVLIDYHDGTTPLTRDDVAFGYELILNKESFEGKFLGIPNMQDPLDLMILQGLISDLRPDLIVDVGTLCGGSATVWAQLQAVLDIPEAKVITFDVVDKISKPVCTNHPAAGCNHPLWAKYTASGAIERFVLGKTGKFKDPIQETAAIIKRFAAKAKVVFINDDSGHTAHHVKKAFKSFHRFVTPGSFLVFQDTRMDRVCEVAQRHRSYSAQHRLPAGWFGAVKCDGLNNKGPAAGLRQLSEEGDLTRAGFVVDRSVERYSLTQHPGGYLKKTAAAHVNVSK